MAVTLPTYAAGNWDHKASVAVPHLLKSIEDLTKIAAPTLDIMWAHKEYARVDINSKFNLNIEYGGSNPRYGTLNMVFNTEYKQQGTRLQFTPNIAYCGCGISDLELRGPYREGTNLVSEIDKRGRDINKGLTSLLAYEVWAPTGYTTTEGTTDEIDLDTVVTNIQTEIKIKNKPVVGGRITSIPSIIKPHGAGHTYGGFSSANKMHQPFCYHNDGFVTIDSTNYATYCAGAPSDNVDLITTMSTTAQWSHENIDSMLDLMQIGAGLEILIGCPPFIYSSIGRYMWGQNYGSQENPLKDLGVNQAFRHPAYNATFYADPFLAVMWPNSLFFYDPEFLHFVCVEECSPLIYPWARVEGSTTVVMAKILWIQLVCTKRNSTGILIGVTK